MSGSEVAQIMQGKPKMSDFMANVISVTAVHLTLKELLTTSLSEKEENQRDKDEYGMEYWDSACQTIYEVATALNIQLEVKS